MTLRSLGRGRDEEGEEFEEMREKACCKKLIVDEEGAEMG